MGRFSESTPRSNRSFKFLPLFHTCDGVDARRYMALGKIETEVECDVFKERITYLFYGRAAYKYDVTDEGTTRLDLYPVCFVFDFDFVPEIRRIYPFDSGAKHNGYLDKFINPKISMVEFEVEPDQNRVADIVVRFFRSNDRYLKGMPRHMTIDPLDFESEAYRAMAQGHVADRSDERRVTIEVQAGSEVPFGNGALKGLICPIQYLDSSAFKAFCTLHPIPIRTYQIAVWNPRASFAVLASTVSQFLDAEALNASQR